MEVQRVSEFVTGALQRYGTT